MLPIQKRIYIGPLEEDRSGITGVMKEELYATRVLAPAVTGVDRSTLPTVSVTAEAGSLSVELPAEARGWVVYRQVGAEWEHVDVVPPQPVACCFCRFFFRVCEIRTLVRSSTCAILILPPIPPLPMLPLE